MLEYILMSQGKAANKKPNHRQEISWHRQLLNSMEWQGILKIPNFKRTNAGKPIQQILAFLLYEYTFLFIVTGHIHTTFSVVQFETSMQSPYLQLPVSFSRVIDLTLP